VIQNGFAPVLTGPETVTVTGCPLASALASHTGNGPVELASGMQSPRASTSFQPAARINASSSAGVGGAAASNRVVADGQAMSMHPEPLTTDSAAVQPGGGRNRSSSLLTSPESLEQPAARAATRISAPVVSEARATDRTGGSYGREVALGRPVPGKTGAMHELVVTDPATGETLATLPCSDVDGLVAVARGAHPAWERTASAERASLVKSAARRLRVAIEQVALLQTREGGKPLADSRGGVEAGIGAIEQYAELGPLHRGRSLQGSWGAVDAMVRVSRGVAALCLPWNDPVAIACAQIAANLVVGNTVICKPSEKTPLSTAEVVRILNDDLPSGVLQLAVGDGRVGAALADHAGVDVVVHVGSVRTGRSVAAACARRGAKAVLELGGKDPLIVDAGVDPAWAAEQAAVGCFANAGQICTSVERVYVHRDVAEPFVDELVARAKALRLGPGTDPTTEMGPMIDAGQRAVVERHVEEAVEAGAELRCGGAPVEGTGSFYPPTVLTGVRPGMAIVEEETFGPVAAVQVVESFDEALALANGTPYGLAAVVLTPDMGHAQEATRELAVGTVKVNAVFGGAPGGAASPHGSSGDGFGYGPELLHELTRVRVVHVEPPPG
jgi:acyl-CoA reductase-like NAD-dependent aldehyde dehydrogenase